MKELIKTLVSAVFIFGLLSAPLQINNAKAESSDTFRAVETVRVYVDLSDKASLYSLSPGRISVIQKYCPRVSQREAKIYLYAAYQIGEEYNIDPDTLIAIAIVETGMQNLTSHKGAEGFTQIMPNIWDKYFDFPDDPKRDLYNPIKSLEITARILAEDGFSIARYSGYTKGYSLKVLRVVRELKESDLTYPESASLF